MRKKSGQGKGFTLIELLVAIGIIIILAGIGIRSYSSLMSRVKDASSRTNLAAIKNALSMYKKDRGEFPPDGNLYAALAKYEVRKSLLTNPYNGKSDANLYVQRTFKAAANAFVLASPSVREEKTAVLLFGHEPQMLTLQRVTSQGTAINPGASLSGSGATLNFASETSGTATVTVEQGTVMLIQSFKLPDGTPYGLVRLNQAGDKVSVDVPHGVTPAWKFEVVTPAAIAGVEGTKFTVKVFKATETEIMTISGTVTVTERTGKGKVKVPAGFAVTVNKGQTPVPQRYKRGPHYGMP
jgi:prepilin-type N-terminal cleavage/methylation domain-containing protein